MKHIEVVAAIVKQGDLYLATQRGYGEFEGFWEFPGGKIEYNESKEAALKREIKEELNISIDIIHMLCTVNYSYPDFQLVMHCFLCTILSGTIELNEHKSAKWLSEKDFKDLEWLPADKEVIQQMFNNHQ